MINTDIAFFFVASASQTAWPTLARPPLPRPSFHSSVAAAPPRMAAPTAAPPGAPSSAKAEVDFLTLATRLKVCCVCCVSMHLVFVCLFVPAKGAGKCVGGGSIYFGFPRARRENKQPTCLRSTPTLQTTHFLQTTPRTGWVRRGVPSPESVADHSHRVALAALVAAAGRPEYNASRAVAIALAHDVAEAVVGDIAPGDGVPKSVKAAAEADAVAEMARLLGGADSAAGSAIASLWAEYEAGQTPEARLVKDCDKVEMLLQAAEYETAHPGLALSEFFEGVRGKLKTEVGRELAAEAEARRPRWARGG